MALYNLLTDTTNNRKRAVAYPGFSEFEEIVAGSPKATFSLGIDIDNAHQIDVWMDGRLQKETTSWSRNAATDQITFTTNIAVGSWVRVRVYLK